MTPEEKTLVVIETILELAEVQIREKPELKNSCSLFVQEVIEEILTNVPPDDVKKIIRKLDRLGIIQNPPFAPEAFICYDTQKLIDYRNKLEKSTDGEQTIEKLEAGEQIKKEALIRQFMHLDLCQFNWVFKACRANRALFTIPIAVIAKFKAFLDVETARLSGMISMKSS